MKKLLASTLSLVSTSALAHSGHGLEEQVHGVLHIEHLITLLAIAVVIFIVKIIKK